MCIGLHCREEYKLFVCIKTPPSCVQKKILKLCFCVWTRMSWPRSSEYHPRTLERQLNYLKCFTTMSPWQPNDMSAMLCHHSFLGAVSSLILLEAILPFLEYLIFFYDFSYSRAALLRRVCHLYNSKMVISWRRTSVFIIVFFCWMCHKISQFSSG